MKTLIGIVLDESSSMYSRKTQVLSGFNKFIEDQKKITEDSARLFLVKFHSTVTVVMKGVPLEEVMPITESDYQPQASTALYDAIAQCVQIMDDEKTSEERAICVIMTDGEENCSQKTTMNDIRAIMKRHEQQDDWSFLYIGVEIAEWVKRSGMMANHCSSGFSKPSGNYPQFQSPNSWEFQNRGNCKTLKLVAPDPQIVGQSTNLHQNWGLRGRNTIECNESEEMDVLTSAITGFRSSKSRSTKTSDDPFNSSN